jgi:site-specific DNA-cytosine methylase
VRHEVINETMNKKGKAYTLKAVQGGFNARFSATKKQRTLWPVCEEEGDTAMHHNGIKYRKLTPIECERLQTFQDGYTEGVSNTQRYKALGNSWTVDVIAHIFKPLLKEQLEQMDKAELINLYMEKVA